MYVGMYITKESCERNMQRMQKLTEISRAPSRRSRAVVVGKWKFTFYDYRITTANAGVAMPRYNKAGTWCCARRGRKTNLERPKM